MPTGTIKRWNHDRGFGFISDDSDHRINWRFVHISELPSSYAPEIDDAYDYATEAGRDGRDRAIRLKRLDS